MERYYISRSWMVSRRARAIYRFAAPFSIGLFVLFLWLIIAWDAPDLLPSSMAPVFRLLLFPCVLGAGIVVVAMEYFLFGFDTSSGGKKSFWFLVMVLLPFLGSAIYCLLVYSNSPILDKAPSERPEGMVEEFRGSKQS